MRRRRVLAESFGILLPALVLVATPRMAHAEPLAQLMVGADGDLVVADTRDRTLGGGVDVRVGFRFGWPRSAFIGRVVSGAMFFQPEAVVGYRQLPFTSEPDDLRIGRASGGLRMGLMPRPCEILFFNHWGSSFGREARLLWDVGTGIDLRSTSMSFGIHATYNHLSDSGAWLEVGPHIEYRSLP
ncbi:hypothetical protein [Labilithrix luteola]|uniref:hypothetical protein n=1 Tax=Labilithrix luteola TaxID=1391654 RepID=UPI001969B875|nr:hypothetical protein [Labilithrix luteola]